MFDYKKRDTPEEINRQTESIVNSPGLSNLIGDIPNMIIILNRNRQVVYMNRPFSELTGKNGEMASTG
jgi:PAS domain-containing protein